MTSTFDTVLVANRGEIARRVIRTLRRLGIRPVAVFSDADAGAPHVREADVAVRLGPAAAVASYLDVDAVVAAARATGAQAIHPGYGFLSESVVLARACAAAGLVFIGPGDHAIEVMGDKIRAKQHVAAAGVPVVPGFSAVGMTDEEVTLRAEATGWPLLIKPSAGGGGKGMQIVRAAADLPEALAAARRVAAAAFGDDTLLLERLVERPRHIEVQVLADQHGTLVHLGERECTLQRRHQKVIEEAPSPAVDDDLRRRLGNAACAAARSVGYVGAGTVEFLVPGDAPDECYFIEMNTRLQVEHPVTELVTGVDLVEQQVRIAAGEPLAFGQDDVRRAGHAIEARVYAESPERGFLPATGEILRWRAPAAAVDSGIRTDAGVETGSVVTADYDPMVAKVIAHGADRSVALARLDAALAETVLLGVDSNLAFLRTLLADPAVAAGELDTGLIDRLPPPVASAPTPAALAAAAKAARRSRAARDGAPARASALWRTGSGWRAGGPAVRPRILLRDESGDIHAVDLHAVDLHGVDDLADAPSRGPETAVDADGAVWVHADGGTWRLRPVDRRAALEERLVRRGSTATEAEPQLRAPMPGTVVAVHVADGDAVASGTRLVTIEAMKMEHSVTAPHDGVARVHTVVGAQVRRDELVAEILPAATPEPKEAPA